jgi:hypothetical protein
MEGKNYGLQKGRKEGKEKREEVEDGKEGKKGRREGREGLHVYIEQYICNYLYIYSILPSSFVFEAETGASRWTVWPCGGFRSRESFGVVGVLVSLSLGLFFGVIVSISLGLFFGVLVLLSLGMFFGVLVSISFGVFFGVIVSISFGLFRVLVPFLFGRVAGVSGLADAAKSK